MDLVSLLMWTRNLWEGEGDLLPAIQFRDKNMHPFIDEQTNQADESQMQQQQQEENPSPWATGLYNCGEDQSSCM